MHEVGFTKCMPYNMIDRKNRWVFSVVCLLEPHTEFKQSQTCRKTDLFSVDGLLRLFLYLLLGDS